MKKSFLFQMVGVIALLALAGCACNNAPQPLVDFTPRTTDLTAYQPNVDNFVIVYDASSSMTFCDNGADRMNTARTVVGKLSLSLPELPMNGALRSFGHSPAVSPEETVLMYGLTPYSTEGLQTGLDRLTKAGGNSPMSVAFDAAGKDLASAQGKIALIVISDGDGMGEEAVASARKLNDEFGERLCIYTIQVGDSAAGASLLEKIAQAGGCGYARNARELASSDGMFAFVEDVFLKERKDTDGDGVYDDEDLCPGTPTGVAVDAEGCPLDKDGDGVADHLDQCPGTPENALVDGKGCPLDGDQDGVADYLDNCPNTHRGAEVDAHGCPVDSDGDGIVDYLDNCPDTPQGTPVDYAGCPMPIATKSATVTDTGTWLYEGIQFDTSRADIKPATYAVLDEIAELLVKNPSLKVEIQGHTDNSGSLDMNMKLSKKRAEAVAAYLVDKGVQADQLTAEGYGPSQPIASNDAPAGRAKNRRVELKPMK